MSVTRTCEYCGSIGMPDGNGGTKNYANVADATVFDTVTENIKKRITNNTSQIALPL